MEGARSSGGLGRLVVLCALVAAAFMAIGASPVSAATLPAGFQDVVAFSGVTGATGVRFSSDGRVFVTQKDGILRVFDSLTDTTSDHRDRPQHRSPQLLGSRPARAGARPEFSGNSIHLRAGGLRCGDRRHGAAVERQLPTPPGPNTDGCSISGRLLRLTLSGNSVTATKVLIKDQWCQQYPSHSIGDLNFGTDGALYVCGGDGASFNFADYGQGGGEPAARRRRTRAAIRRQGSAGRDAADRRGRRAASPELPPAERRASAAERGGAAGRPGNGGCDARQPGCGQRGRRTRGGSSPTGFATRSASRSGR